VDRERARDHALRPPLLLAFIVRVQPRSGIPEREQWLAAGAALGNLLNAAHLQGFGAIVLSGDRCFDNILQRQIGLAPTEELVGFVSVGTVVREPPERSAPDAHMAWSSWQGSRAASSFIS
jgi:nitroreductase